MAPPYGRGRKRDLRFLRSFPANTFPAGKSAAGLEGNGGFVRILVGDADLNRMVEKGFSGRRRQRTFPSPDGEKGRQKKRWLSPEIRKILDGAGGRNRTQGKYGN